MTRLTEQTSAYILTATADSTKLAERTGLEPATPGVTGRYSNQLNYRSVVVTIRTKIRALTNGALPKNLTQVLVGVAGVEPATYAL